MPNWKRLILGDAFKLSSKDPNYYRDLALFWPFLLFTVATGTALLGQPLKPDYLYKSAIGLFLCLVLAKERLWLIIAASGFIAFRCLFAMAFNWDNPLFPELFLWFLVSCLVALAALYYVVHFREGWLSYEMPRKMYVSDLVIGVGSLGITIAVFVYWVRK